MKILQCGNLRSLKSQIWFLFPQYTRVTSTLPAAYIECYLNQTESYVSSLFQLIRSTQSPWLTPWNKIVLEEQIVFQLVIKFPTFYGARRLTFSLQPTICPYPKPDVVRLISFTNFNAQFLYSLTICMLHYNPRHVSSINIPIFRKTNCIITASGIVTLCTAVYRERRYQMLW